MSYHDDLISDGLEPLLYEFRNLPVYNEPGILNSDRTEAHFGYQNWTSGISAPEIIKNEDTYLTSDTNYRANYLKGKIDLAPALSSGDEITGTYRFRYFTDSVWVDFLDIALKEMNSKKPASSYSIESMPLDFDPYIILRSYVFSLRRLLLDSILWSTRLIFSDPAQMFSIISALLTQAIAELIDLKNIKRRGEVSPKVVTSYRRSIPRKVTGVNYKSYTLLGAYSVDG